MFISKLLLLMLNLVLHVFLNWLSRALVGVLRAEARGPLCDLHDHFTGYPFGLQSFQLFSVSFQDFKVNSVILMQISNFIKS